VRAFYFISFVVCCSFFRYRLVK